MRCLVTGGCGFLGSTVVRALLDRGDRVLNIDTHSRIAPVPSLDSITGRPGYARLEANVADRSLMRAITAEFKPHCVIHLTAPTADDEALEPEDDINASLSVMEACRFHLARIPTIEQSAFRLVHALNARHAEVGGHGLPDLSPREAASAASGRLIETWSRAQGIPTTTCLADALFGPWQPEGALITDLLVSLLEGESYTLENAGETLRDWLTADDFASGLIAAALHGQAFTRYSFSAGAERSDLDMALTLCGLLDGLRPHPTRGGWMEMVEMGPRGYAPPPPPVLLADKAQAELGWSPAGFHDGLGRIVPWILSRLEPAPSSPLAAE
jgi:dTDP-glucose 4,6-dehydratase